MGGEQVGSVQALFSADTKTFDASVQGTERQLKAASMAAEAAGNAIAGAGDKIDRTAAMQERAMDRARAAWQRELLVQERAAQADAAATRAKELAALRTDILTRSAEKETEAVARAAEAHKLYTEALGTGREMIGAIAPIGALFGVGAAAEGLKRMMDSTMETAVELGHLSVQTGISAQNLSVLRYAAQQTGVDFDVLTRGFKRLAVTAYDADNGNKTAAKGFAQLGISVEQLRAQGNDMYGVLSLLAQKFAEMPDGIAQADTAAKIFGTRMGSEMIPILKQLGGNLDELKAQATTMGVVWDKSGIEKMEQMHRSSEQLKASLQGLGAEITTTLAPAIERLSGATARFIDEWRVAPGNMFRAAIGNMIGFYDPEKEQAKAYAAAFGLSRPGLSALPAAPGLPTGYDAAAWAGNGGSSDNDGGTKRAGAASSPAPQISRTEWDYLTNPQRITGAPGLRPEFQASIANAQAVMQDLGEDYAAMVQKQADEMQKWMQTPFPQMTMQGGTAEQYVRTLTEWQQVMEQLRDTAKGLADQFTDTGRQLTEIFTRGLHDFNSTAIAAMTGSNGRNAHPWTTLGHNLAASGAGAALEHGEGMLMKAFGVHGKSDGYHTWVDNMPGGAGAGGGARVPGGSVTGAASRGLLGMFNDSNFFSSMFGGRLFGSGSFFGNLGHFAEGGAIPSNMPSIVGESGPEMFIPSTSGRIVPNNQLVGSTSHTWNVDARGTDPALTMANFQRALAQTHASAVAHATAVMADHQRRTAQ